MSKVYKYQVEPHHRFLHLVLERIKEQRCSVPEAIDMATDDLKKISPPILIKPIDIDNVAESIFGNGFAVPTVLIDGKGRYCCSLTEIGERTLGSLVYRIDKEKEIRDKIKGASAINMSELEKLFRNGSVVILPVISKNTDIIQIIFCPQFGSRENIVEIEIPRSFNLDSCLTSETYDHKIFMAFAMIMTLSGIDVRLPDRRFPSTTLPPIDLMIDERSDDGYLELVSFDPANQTHDVPLVCEQEIDSLLKMMQEDL